MNRPVMILAAGLGTRMKPLTDVRPKPLIKVAGQTLLEHVLDRVEELSPSRIIINIHAHARMMRSFLQEKADSRIVISDESDQLLDSGGGMAKAFGLHDEEDMLCLNGDIFWPRGASSSLSRLTLAHVQHDGPASLLLGAASQGTGYDGQGDFTLDQKGIIGKPVRAPKPFVFLGAQILPRAPFEGRVGEAFSVRDIWQPWLDEGVMHGLRHDGLWCHVGSPQAIEQAEKALQFHGN